MAEMLGYVHKEAEYSEIILSFKHLGLGLFRIIRQCSAFFQTILQFKECDTTHNYNMEHRILKCFKTCMCYMDHNILILQQTDCSHTIQYFLKHYTTLTGNQLYKSHRSEKCSVQLGIYNEHSTEAFHHLLG